MKIRPVILCGGEGNRLWPKSKNNQAKQFINFGGWNLFEKTLDRIKGKIFDYPIISTNSKYLKQVKQHLKKHKIRKFKIVLEQKGGFISAHWDGTNEKGTKVSTGMYIYQLRTNSTLLNRRMTFVK